MAQQVNRDDYFRAAMEVLAARGAGELKIGVLCRSLGVTTGSFYHHFGSLRTFVDLLLAHWEHEQTETYAELAAAVEQPELAVALLKESAIGLPHRAEAAIRAWSHLDPHVAAAQARVDVKRRAVARDTLRRIVEDANRADRLAQVALMLLIGFQLGGNPDNVAEFRALMDEFELLIYASIEDAARS